eukprot:TRINITY_DN3443_c1_g2_i4.p1 TRINITY_DN3443_c1_g2~~TRINITY_DN3443_c1_g2_i4.p1  ORF type:complete len:103 (+),score=9.00 TRINITY_DN3443_c1_g2_i4:66-374(+)
MVQACVARHLSVAGFLEMKLVLSLVLWDVHQSSGRNDKRVGSNGGQGGVGCVVGTITWKYRKGWWAAICVFTVRHVNAKESGLKHDLWRQWNGKPKEINKRY